MAGFIKLRYNANGLLKNRIINADSIEAIEPFSAPGGRYVEETRSRIYMKSGIKYDMSLSVDELQKLLNEAGSMVAELHSMPPVQQTADQQTTKISGMPATPASFPKRAVLVKQAPEAVRKIPADPNAIKAADGARKLAEAMRR